MGSNVYISAAGAAARLQQLEIVANNLANSQSTGFKADRPIFEAAFASALQQEEGFTRGAPGGVYVRVGETGFDHAPGPIVQTGAPLDVAVDGRGFFVVGTREGDRYTRAGSFVIDADKRLVTPAGHPAKGGGGPIRVTGGDVRIRANGDIVDAEGSPLGRLRIVEFADPSRLSKTGDGLFRAPEDMPPEKVATPTLLEGSLEGSNVQPVVEMATLMILQRAFDASMQAMQLEDQATERLIQEISR